eukprot:2027588-Prymnesium_polylepis.1
MQWDEWAAFAELMPALSKFTLEAVIGDKLAPEGPCADRQVSFVFSGCSYEVKQHSLLRCDKVDERRRLLQDVSGFVNSGQ